jgi:anti-anti-sigma factor
VVAPVDRVSSIGSSVPKGEDEVATLEGVAVAPAGDGVVVVSFTDEHDLTTSFGISELLDGLIRENELVVADFSDALFVDSSTLRVLVEAHKLALDRGTGFKLQLGDGCTAKRTLEISGLLKEISWAATREEALNGAKPAPSDGSHAAAA